MNTNAISVYNALKDDECNITAFLVKAREMLALGMRDYDQRGERTNQYYLGCSIGTLEVLHTTESNGRKVVVGFNVVSVSGCSYGTQFVHYYLDEDVWTFRTKEVSL